jgi:hypothetical protein
MTKELLSILGIVLTALLGVLAYATQEHLKRKAALDERRQALYEKLIRDLVDLLIATSGAERSRLITEIEKGWLFASDGVLKACYKFLAIYDRLCHENVPKGVALSSEVLTKVRSDKRVRQEIALSLAGIFLAMRRDVRHDNKIKDNWAKAHFQIYEWGAIDQSHKADDSMGRKYGANRPIHSTPGSQ